MQTRASLWCINIFFNRQMAKGVRRMVLGAEYPEIFREFGDPVTGIVLRSGKTVRWRSLKSPFGYLWTFPCFKNSEPFVMQCTLHSTLAEAEMCERSVSKAVPADVQVLTTPNVWSFLTISIECNFVFCPVLISSLSFSFANLLIVEDVNEHFEVLSSQNL